MDENLHGVKPKSFKTEQKNHFRLYFYSAVRSVYSFFLFSVLFICLTYSTVCACFFIRFYGMVSIYSLNVRIAVAFVVVQMAMQWCVYCGFVLLFCR